MNQLPLEDILMASQMSPPHGPGIVTMREATFDQLAPLTKQALAISPRYPQPIGINSLLLILPSNPRPLAGLLLFRSLTSAFSFFRRHELSAAIVTLVPNDF